MSGFPKQTAPIVGEFNFSKISNAISASPDPNFWIF